MTYLFLLFAAFAQGSDQSSTMAPLAYPAPEGIYDLTDRRCQSGTPTRDGFDLQRDFTEIHFEQDGSYSILTLANSCIFEAWGEYAVSGTTLNLYQNGARDCRGRRQGMITLSFPFRSIDNLLHLYSSGQNSGGACPFGDTLEVTLTRRQTPTP